MGIKEFKEWLLHYSWDLAFGDYNEKIITNGLSKTDIKIIKNPYKNKWFADPFILDENDSTLFLLVEEFDYTINRGRIARLSINKNSQKIEECKIILDLPTHLSFPAIYSSGDDIWVLPENSKSGYSYIYRYDKDRDLLVDQRLIMDEPLVDAIICQEGEKYLMYATKEDNPNGDELHNYEADDFFGPYSEKLIEKMPSNYARMAGYMILKGGEKIRPAQNCNGAYGRAVFFVKDKDIVGKVVPNSIKHAGVHTFNTNGKTFIIDLKRYDFPYLYWIKEKLKNI